MPKPFALDIKMNEYKYIFFSQVINPLKPAEPMWVELTSLDQSQFAIYIRDIQSNQVQQVYHTTTNLTNKET